MTPAETDEPRISPTHPLAIAVSQRPKPASKSLAALSIGPALTRNTREHALLQARAAACQPSQ